MVQTPDERKNIFNYGSLITQGDIFQLFYYFFFTKCWFHSLTMLIQNLQSDFTHNVTFFCENWTKFLLRNGCIEGSCALLQVKSSVRVKKRGLNKVLNLLHSIWDFVSLNLNTPNPRPMVFFNIRHGNKKLRVSVGECSDLRSNKYTLFNFLGLKRGSFSRIYLKRASSLLRAYTNCFMRSSLRCNGGNIKLDLSIRASCKALS